ncbi:MAG: hypothetical protein K6C08_09300 [Oscillospiraceae bacterium]|nr:hypothetical protein [Oscillospiraceae bacterium]
MIRIVPVEEPVIRNGAPICYESDSYTPYLVAEYVAFELCPYRILFIFLALLIMDRKLLSSIGEKSTLSEEELNRYVDVRAGFTPLVTENPGLLRRSVFSVIRLV